MAEKEISKKEDFEPLQTIGIFWSVFGILILIGILFSTSLLGKMANGICGGILLITGLSCYFRGTINKRRRLEKLKRTK
ncbi:hypothetical protein KAW18_12005 [candidate division WOR-3 bacterium]|nr:hypothetical protein [candidate division WOR-3 bacterium]MCK4528085.1 hypothetical protein [candidate division WOR-3 bacterium]